MGAVSGLLGLGGGAAGTSFQGPQAAPLTAPTTAGQLGTAYTGNQGALTSQQQLLAALQAQNGVQNQSQVYGQLQGVANGTGPNPALAQLQQQTGQNVANQSALMAGQRGAGANVGLIARQAAQQGAATQQQAVGQAATLQAQQQLGAIGQAGQIAGQQVQNQIGATSANTQAQQAEQAALLQAQQGYNTTLQAQQANINTANAGLAGTQMGGQQKILGGIGQGLAGAAGTVGTSTPAIAGAGDAIAAAAEGGQIQDMPATPASSFGDYLAKMAMGGSTQDYRSGGGVNAQTQGQKAVKSGNSYANDKIPAVLSEGEVVIPRNVMQSKDPARGAAEFVQAVLAKRRSKR